MAVFHVNLSKYITPPRNFYIALIVLSIVFSLEICEWTTWIKGRSLNLTTFVLNQNDDRNSSDANYSFIVQSDYYQCPKPTHDDDNCLIQPNKNTQCKITDIQQDLDPHYHFSPMPMPNDFVFFAVCLPSYVPIEHYQSNLSHFPYSMDDGNTDAQNGDVVSYHETPGNVYALNR